MLEGNEHPLFVVLTHIESAVVEDGEDSRKTNGTWKEQSDCRGGMQGTVTGAGGEGGDEAKAGEQEILKKVIVRRRN